MDDKSGSPSQAAKDLSKPRIIGRHEDGARTTLDRDCFVRRRAHFGAKNRECHFLRVGIEDDGSRNVYPIVHANDAAARDIEFTLR